MYQRNKTIVYKLLLEDLSRRSVLNLGWGAARKSLPGDRRRTEYQKITQQNDLTWASEIAQ